jgi:uncharacterized membrane protein
MKKKSYLKTIFIFSLIGVLFSGYLSFTKLFLGSCPLTEGCPTFLGYPACYFGFVFFLALLIFSIISFKNPSNKNLKIIYYISLLAIIFATYSTIKELLYPSCLNGICNYSLLLPTCVYGLIMYIIIFTSSFLALRKQVPELLW